MNYWFDGDSYTTWFRVNLPIIDVDSLSAPGVMGVVLFVEGGTGADDGVHRLEAINIGTPIEVKDTPYDVFWRLASGISADDDDDVNVEEFVYRTGDPLITVYFTQPGRGPDENPDDEDPEMRATGSTCADYATPLNTTGRDFWGPQTMEVMDLVMAAVEQIVAAQAEVSLRIIVLSFSAGLFAASRWVAETNRTIHAHVDYEGPPGSDWLAGTYRVDGWLSGTITYEAWESAVIGNPDSFGFVFVPSQDALGVLPMDVDSILDGLEDAEGYSEYWAARYGPDAYDPTTLKLDATAFWMERSPSVYLGNETANGTIYVRIQNETDHAADIDAMDDPDDPAPHFGPYKAIEALNRAWEGVLEGGYVYLADYAYVFAPSAGPSQITEEFESVDDLPTLSDSIEMTGALLTFIEVDLVRWAFQATPGTTEPPSSEHESYVRTHEKSLGKRVTKKANIKGATTRMGRRHTTKLASKKKY